MVQETIKSYYGEESVAKYNCGNNSREAISLGCVFDMSAIGWVPHQCQDPYMRDRYDSYGFKYYEDEARTIEASLDRFAASATEEEPRDMFYPTPGFHENHCSLTWERMHRTAMLGKRVLKHVMNFKHTLHCGELLDTPHEFVSLPIAALLHTC